MRRLRSGWRIFRRSRQGIVGLAVLSIFIVIAVVGPMLVGPVDRPGTYDPLLQPSWAHLFGTDRAGRDNLTTFINGARISIIVGIVASVLSMVIGAGIGILAGYRGGRLDGSLMRITDFFYVLPTLVLAVVLAAVLGPSLTNVIVVIAITSWPGTARIIRAQTLSLRERSFVARARAYGAGDLRVMSRHILPNVFGLILANTTLTVAGAIFFETTLSFLGVGVKDTFSWGRMLEESFDAGALTLGLWAWFVPPGVAVVLVVLAFTLIGQAFDEILDPRLRERGRSGEVEDQALSDMMPVMADQR